MEASSTTTPPRGLSSTGTRRTVRRSGPVLVGWRRIVRSSQTSARPWLASSETPARVATRRADLWSGLRGIPCGLPYPERLLFNTYGHEDDRSPDGGAESQFRLSHEAG